jgi:predicted phage gp36 major capsid-like protein
MRETPLDRPATPVMRGAFPEEMTIVTSVQTRLAELEERRAGLEAQLQEIHDRAGDRALTEGEQQRWDRLTAGLDNIKHEKRELIRELAANPANRISGDGATGAPEHPEHSPRPGNALRDSALRVIEQSSRGGLLPDHAAQRTTALVDSGPAPNRRLAARWAIAAGDPEYREAFAALLADPARGHLLWTPAQAEAYRRAAAVHSELRAMSVGLDAAGGFMVPLTLDPTILLTSDGSINPLRRISRVVQTATDSWTGITSAGATAEWKAEAAQVADGSPTVDDTPIPVHFGDSFVPYSSEVGMDAVNFLDELTRVLLAAADQLQATGYTTGTGTGQPKGIITALAGTASEINGSGTEALLAADAYTLQNALPPRSRPAPSGAPTSRSSTPSRRWRPPTGRCASPRSARASCCASPSTSSPPWTARSTRRPRPATTCCFMATFSSSSSWIASAPRSS